MMRDSDEEYIQDLSDDEIDTGGAGGYGTRSKGSRSKAGGGQGTQRREKWEDIKRSWEQVTEGADGTLSGAVEGLLEAGKRKRLLKDTTPLQRGIIRHVLLVLDMSMAMAEKDMRPTRYLLSIRYASNFVTEFFEQNPISQLGILGMRDGLAVRVSEMSGNPNDHLAALQKLRSQDPKGSPSLQNALDMCRGALFHTPSHGTREVIVVFGALLSLDPGDIHVTIRSLVADKIRVSVVGLAARLAICTELCCRTNGVSRENNSYYGVAMNETHLRELLLSYTTPPLTRQSDQSSAPSLLMMGFPSRIEEDHATLCACHGRESRGGYLCSRCQAKICSLPAQCPVCDLQLIQSTHLARSYHHLFPLRNYVEVSWIQARRKQSGHCFACLTVFPAVPSEAEMLAKRKADVVAGRAGAARRLHRGASESSRYRCTVCDEHFCIDCDVLAHEVTHNCAGCLCRPQDPVLQEAGGLGPQIGDGAINGAGVSAGGINGARNQVMDDSHHDEDGGDGGSMEGVVANGAATSRVANTNSNGS